MGGEAFVQLKITEKIGKGHIKIIPDVLISGGNGSTTEGGSVAGLMGLKMMEMMGANKSVAKSDKTDAPKVE